MRGAGRAPGDLGGAAGQVAVAVLVLLLAGACRSPVGVKRVDAQRVHRDLTANVLSTGKPSDRGSQALHRDDLVERFDDDPAGALAEMRARWLADPGPRRLFALAELSFVHAENGGGRPYHLAAAVYAYALLFSGPSAEAPDALDPRLRLAADLYNRGLTEGLMAPDGELVDLGPRALPLPFGELLLASDPSSFLYLNHELDEFSPVAELEVRGLSSRYRRRGIGVPLAAHVGPIAQGRSEQRYEEWLPPGMRIASTAVVRLDRVREGIAAGRVEGRVSLYLGTVQSVEIAGHRVPLEYEPTAAMALSLDEAKIWKVEIAGFLGKDVEIAARSNLVMLSPHARGKTPVVLVHGTASSPARWIEMINELGSDWRLSDDYEFWLFFYKTGNPVLYSGMKLRQALNDAIHSLDPQGTDPGLQRMVVIGHSQGGLLTKLQAVDSGDRFWRAVSDGQISELDLDPETQALLEAAFFFEAVPQVRRVVFVSTPHGGSYLAGRRVSSLAAKVVRLPGDLARASLQVLDSDDVKISRATLGHMPSSIDNMTPGNVFLVTLHETPLADHVSGHSIIAVKSEGPLLGQTDGVVRFESAQIEGMASEKVVISGHSGSQDHPDSIAEVRRILLENLEPK